MLVLGFWAAGLPAILDPDHNLAITPTYAIANANLFFFSYASMMFSILLLGSWYEDMRGDEASPTAQQWLLLAAVSLTGMSSSVAYYQSSSCKQDDSELCRRTRFSVYLGMTTAILSLACVAARSKLPLECQGLTSFLLIVCWACAVSYVTFGSGPGTTLGSLYFATWAAFFLCINITATAVKTVIEEKNIRVTVGETPPANNVSVTSPPLAGEKEDPEA